TGLPVTTDNLTPQGSFNFIPQKIDGQPKRYTMPEIVDLLNGQMLQQNMLLIRGEANFFVVAADKPINPILVVRISEADLPKHGRSEIVSLVKSLKGLNAEDIAADWKPRMTPFGMLQALKPNNLLIQDNVGNIRLILGDLESAEKGEGGQSESFTYDCQHVKS